MYLHKPDLLSLAFGALFLVAGIAALAGQPLFGDPWVVLGGLALALGVGIAGRLATGDVHAEAGRRIAARQEARRRAAAPAEAPSAAALPDPPTSILDDPLFGPPIDPDALDRAYRETFGEDGRDQGPGQATTTGS